MQKDPDFYRALGVPEEASQAEIKARFHELAKRHHPDAAGGNEAAFKRVAAAYETLGEPSKRSMYDDAREFGIPFDEEGGGASGGWAGGGYGGFDKGAGERRAGGSNAGRRGFHRFLGKLFQPRVFALVSVATIGSLAFKDNRGAGGASLVDDGGGAGGGGGGGGGAGGGQVQAWKNPQTGRWETPQPWNPLYREHRHTQQLMPRSSVSAAVE